MESLTSLTPVGRPDLFLACQKFITDPLTWVGWWGEAGWDRGRVELGQGWAKWGISGVDWIWKWDMQPPLLLNPTLLLGPDPKTQVHVNMCQWYRALGHKASLDFVGDFVGADPRSPVGRLQPPLVQGHEWALHWGVSCFLLSGAGYSTATSACLFWCY